MTKNKKPEIVNLPAGKLDEIKARVETNTVLDEDKKIIIIVLSTYAWLHRQLEAKKLGIQRLRSLFGFSTEKKSSLNTGDNDTPPDVNSSQNTKSSSDASSGNKVTPIKKYQSGTQRQIMGD